MKITSSGLPTLPAASPVAETAPVASSAASTGADAGALQSSTLQAARNALQAMPEIDEAKVAAMREALAKGEINFDPAKLASLISRYHGSKA
jgi:negative regulator of flagellin synthesis FlgM